MKRIILLFICSIFITACNSNSLSNTNSHTGTNPHIIIDWIDFVKIDDIQYEAIYSGVIADPQYIGEEIAQVNFKVNENVTNPNYNIENGDAAFWEEGTKIFAVKDMPESIAIQDDTEINGYRIYYSTNSEKYKWHYPDINDKKVTKIEIYKGYDHPDLLQTYSDEQKIAEFIDIFNDGEEDASFIEDTSKGDSMMYHIIFYDNQPIATTESLFFDGNVWYWHPDDIAILSNEIEKFMKE